MGPYSNSRRSPLEGFWLLLASLEGLALESFGGLNKSVPLSRLNGFVAIACKRLWHLKPPSLGRRSCRADELVQRRPLEAFEQFGGLLYLRLHRTKPIDIPTRLFLSR
jgi:hypothetical protein